MRILAPRSSVISLVTAASRRGLPSIIQDPQGYKTWLRWQREKVQARQIPRSYREAFDEAMAFWTHYEQVNRDFLPDDPVYSIFRSGAALSTTADHLGFGASSTGQVRMLEIIIGGEATASAVNRIVMQLSGNPTGQTAITPEKFNTHSPAAAGVYGHSSTTALSGNPKNVFAFNAFGGFVDYKYPPGGELYFKDGDELSWRSASGTSTCSSTGIFEEL